MSIHQCSGVKITFDNLPSTQPCADRLYPNQDSERFPQDSDLNLYPSDRFCDPNYKPAKPLEGRFDPWNGTNDAEHNTRIFSVGSSEVAKEYQKNLEAYHKVVKDIVEKQPEKETTSTQFAEEHRMTDKQVNEVIKANEEAVATNKNEIWISAVLADEIKSRLNHLYTTFKSVVYDKSSNFTDREKITVTDDRCEALISVDPKQLEVFIANLKYAAKQASDLVACVPEKPVENPIHPNKPAIAEPTTPKESEKLDSSSEKNRDEERNRQVGRRCQGSVQGALERYLRQSGFQGIFRQGSPDIEPDCESEIGKDKLEYMSGNHMLTPDGIDTIMRGNTPVLPAYHVGMRPSDPTVTPYQWRAMMESNAQVNKETIIPGATPFDPKTVTRFTDDYKNPKTAVSTPNPPVKPTAWTSDGHPFDTGHNYGHPEPVKVKEETPMMPKVYDVPKEMVDMVEHLPNDLWRYNVIQDENAIKLTLNYDARPRHIHIIVNTGDEEVTINTNREFRGSYSTTLSWDSHAADDGLCPNRQRLFRWLRTWIKDIME